MSYKNFNQSDIFHIYKTAYDIDINWNEVLDDDVHDWVELFARAYNCSKTLIISSLMAMTSTLCGPNTRVQGNGEAFSTKLNSFIFSVSDPGSGKSTMFEKIMEPIFDKYFEKVSQNLQLENYTTAGIHKHQISNNGYGLITSDERHRFLSSIQNKHSKGESERALLCKLWNGKGDYVSLANGTRGFKETSMSLYILIQPQPFMSELSNFTVDDGLLDRFLIFAVKPIMNNSSIVRDSFMLLQENSLTNLSTVFMQMYDDHLNSRKVYTLTREAQNIYDEFTDSYAEYVQEKYNDNCKENIPPSQILENSFMISSKDTIHILRIACLLHIINGYLKRAINQRLYAEMDQIETSINAEELAAAKKMYHSLSKQKSVFREAVNNINATVSISVPKVKSFKERVARCLCNKDGPMISLRHLQRHLKGSLAENIRYELEDLQRSGFGQLKTLTTGKTKRDWFMKPDPHSLSENDNTLSLAKVDFDTYCKKFKVKTNDIPLSQHFQNEIIASYFD